MSLHRWGGHALASLGFSALLTLTACQGGAADAAVQQQGQEPPAVVASDGKSGPLGESRKYGTDVLIYDGVAAAYHDAESLESIATSRGLTVRRASSDEFNQMSVDELADYGVIVWTGGYAMQQSKSLTQEARSRIREAVVERGVGFMGICAGAWMAVGTPPDQQKSGDWGLGIVPGEVMEEYMPSGEDGIEMTPVTIAGQSSPLDLVWWGGPALPEWKGGVVARYKDGTPAIAQAWAGHGFVVLTSPHPEAPQRWRDENGLNDSDGTDKDFEVAVSLIHAALDQKPLQTL